MDRGKIRGWPRIELVDGSILTPARSNLTHPYLPMRKELGGGQGTVWGKADRAFRVQCPGEEDGAWHGERYMQGLTEGPEGGNRAPLDGQCYHLSFLKTYNVI